MLFNFGDDKSKINFEHSGPVLVRLGGCLLVDSGNETIDYLIRCQERYLTYASLAKMRCLFLAENESRWKDYQDGFVELKIALSQISKAIGIDFPELTQPVCLGFDLDKKLIFKLAGQKDDYQKFLSAGVYFNQISPLGADIYKQIFRLHGLGEESFGQVDRLGELALKFNSKANYVELIKNYQGKPSDLPKHTPTLLVDWDILSQIRWGELNNMFVKTTGMKVIEALYIKSSLDAGGEVSAAVAANNFEAKMKQLKIEFEKKTRSKENIRMLIQAKVEVERGGDLPVNLGFVYEIRSENQIEKIDIHGQVYADQERLEYLGSYLSQRLENKVLESISEEKIINLCKIYAVQGYRGPINFDAIKNKAGEIEFIYDCNPRMSAVLPNLLVKNYLNSQGSKVESLVNIGYRGRAVCSDLEKNLEQLQSLGLLFTLKNNKGILLLPNLAKRQGYDVWMINMSMEEMQNFVQRYLMEIFVGIEVGGAYL